MNKDIYCSAMDRIKASDEFKQRILSSPSEEQKYHFMKQSSKGKSFQMKRLIPSFTLLILILSVGTFFLPQLLNKSNQIVKQDRINEPGDANVSNQVKGSDDFKILERDSGVAEEACYISVVYLDGYAYSPSEWLSYSFYSTTDTEDYIKGDMLGEVTLDLKGLRYTGTPPDFSSTYDVGTEVYEIVGIKRERAMLVKNDSYESIFYRERKAVSEIDEPINLTVSEVIAMMTDNPMVDSVELRSEEDGSWMRTSQDQQLIDIINRELPNLTLMNREELGKDMSGYRIPINLMFEDGAALHMQVYPEENCAYIFGGYIIISDELASEAVRLFEDGGEYPRVTDLLPSEVTDATSEVAYLNFKDYSASTEVSCEDPKWSIQAFYQMLEHYRVSKLQQEKMGTLVMTATLGKSQEESMEISFYEDDNKNIYIGLKGDFYEIVKGKLKYEQLRDYLKNYTELGDQ